ncbi:MAG: hypothetical protein JWL69_2131, partial [Phycisphaerales bacterium]|nr:hypothetical protein [Phycisphaerales bacterium]
MAGIRNQRLKVGTWLATGTSKISSKTGMRQVFTDIRQDAERQAESVLSKVKSLKSANL